MTKNELDRLVSAAKAKTREALQTVYDALNQDEQANIIKDEKVKALFELYGVAYKS